MGSMRLMRRLLPFRGGEVSRITLECKVIGQRLPYGHVYFMLVVEF
jgi:hypothetical protein